MKKILLAIFLIIPYLTQAQINLHLNCTCKDTATGFRNVQVIDNRDGQKILGFVHSGLMNSSKQIIYEGNLADSLALYFRSKNEDSANQKSLVFILNELFMNENTREIPENGKFKLSARFFLENDLGKYSEIFTVDSVFTVKGLDVTNKLLRTVSEQFCIMSQIVSNSRIDLANPSFTRGELANMDSLEMSKIPVFSNPTPYAGIYKDYAHFRENTPDVATNILVEKSRKGKISVYRMYGKKKFLMESKGIYAISDGIHFYKATPTGFSEIQNVNHQLYYNRSGSFTDISYNAIWGMYFGAAGSLMVSTLPLNKNYMFRFKINHRKGNSIPVGISE